VRPGAAAETGPGVNLLGTWRRRLGRAAERGDPRLGILIGAAISLAVAAAFGARAPLAQKAENAALDAAFRLRPPIRESDRIVLVDMDDGTFRDLRWPLPREYFAHAILALDRLGARRIALDVEFKMAVPRPGEFDEETGESVLNPSDRALRFAIARSGKVLLAYHFELTDPLSPAARERFPRVLELLAKDFAAEPGQIAQAAGLPEEELQDEMVALRHEAALELVGGFLAERPEATFADVRARFLPRYDARLHRAELKRLQYAYGHARARARLAKISPFVRIEGLPARLAPVHGVVPPAWAFLEAARGAGLVNAAPDPDGTMRRPWTHLVQGARAYPYLGLESALHLLADEKGPVEATLRPWKLDLRCGDWAFSLPLDEEGRLLVDWAGNRHRRRGREAQELPFTHVPFLVVLSYYEARYESLDATVRRTLAQLDDAARVALGGDEYVRLSDRLRKALAGKEDLAPEEARAIEARMDEIRRGMIREFEAEVGRIEASLAGIASPRIRERSEQALAGWRTQLAALKEADDLEKKLRPLVEGRLCLIGSASTASGDLHPTPLGESTPGMDVLANVANMVLTRQALGRAPRGVEFAYVLGVGLAATLAVTYGSSVASAAALAALAALIVGLGAFALAGAALFLPMAGPLSAAAFAFAGTTAYKELVAQRSRRKLQRELEKNTSAELVTILLEHPELLARPRKMEGTFFFSDIRSFTSISERMAPEVLVPFVNRYLDRMTRALKGRKAYVDKYLGDGIMALFGIPVPSPEHAAEACRAALECRALLGPLNEELAREGLPQISSRIGIHSGEAIAGYVGAADRSDYTVLGDAVNLAARLEGVNKEFGTSILVSDATRERSGARFRVRDLGHVRVVGKREPVGIYELLAAAGEPLPFDEAALAEYEAALALFRGRRWAEALEGFRRALARRPGDGPSHFYAERARSFLAAPPPEEWDGVFDLTSK
jgi:adenylate cyclase